MINLVLLVLVSFTFVAAKDLPSIIHSPNTEINKHFSIVFDRIKPGVNSDWAWPATNDDDMICLFTFQALDIGDSFSGHEISKSELGATRCVEQTYPEENWDMMMSWKTFPARNLHTNEYFRPIGVNDVGESENAPWFRMKTEVWETDDDDDPCTFAGDNYPSEVTQTILFSQFPKATKKIVLTTAMHNHQVGLTVKWEYNGPRSSKAGEKVAIFTGQVLDVDAKTQNLPNGKKIFHTHRMQLNPGGMILWNLEDDGVGDYKPESKIYFNEMLPFQGTLQRQFFFRLPIIGPIPKERSFFIRAPLNVISSSSVADWLTTTQIEKYVNINLLPMTGNQPMPRTHNTSFVVYPESHDSPIGGLGKWRAIDIHVYPSGLSAPVPQDTSVIEYVPPPMTEPQGPDVIEPVVTNENGIIIVGETRANNDKEGPDSPKQTQIYGSGKVEEPSGPGIIAGAPPWFVPVVASSIGGTLLLLCCGICCFVAHKRRKLLHEADSGSGGGGGGNRRGSGAGRRTRGYSMARRGTRTHTGAERRGTRGLAGPKAFSGSSEYGNLTLKPRDNAYPSERGGGGGGVMPYPSQSQAGSAYPSQSHGGSIYPSQTRPLYPTAASSSSNAGMMSTQFNRAAGNLKVNESGILEPVRQQPYNELPAARFNSFV